MRTAMMLALLGFTAQAQAVSFLISERNQQTVHQWNPNGSSSVYHSGMRTNDVDVNVAEGSTLGWSAEHFGDTFSTFVPGSGSGTVDTYSVGYAYPKHITVFNGQVMISDRNNSYVNRYDLNGNLLGGFDTQVGGRGQGMATDGTSLFVSLWLNNTSYFNQYNANFQLVNTFANPTGLDVANIVDFAYDASTGNFFGLGATFEQGTATYSDTVYEFAMGGGVLASYDLGFQADGIGQLTAVPVPAAVWLFGSALAGLGWLRRKPTS